MPSPSLSADELATHRADPASPQQEKLRQSYLTAMGIQAWYPRFELTNALAPRPFDWCEEDAQAADDKNIAVPTQQSAQPTADYSPTRPADILGQFTTPATPAPTQPNPAKPLTVSLSKFRLLIQSVSDECLVVAEMPHSGLNQFSRYHRRLLNDILRALTLPHSNNHSVREFVWPMAEKRGLLSTLSQDDSAAADAVDAYLNNQYGLSRRKVVLLLGQSAARFVLNPQKNFEQLRGISKNKANQWFAVSHSLNELMKQPVLKKEAWQDLAPLIEHLAEPTS